MPRIRTSSPTGSTGSNDHRTRSEAAESPRMSRSSRDAENIDAPRPAKKRKTWKLEADHKVWTTTYWPYSDFGGRGTGNPKSNLWADRGALEKFDRLREARGMEIGAKRFEKTPALAWLADSKATSGYFIPGATLREDDAERTTGVDLTGNGKVEPHTKFDFLDDFQNFGENGKTNGTLSVGWWGSCDQVAVAGQLFERPKKGVTIDGVHFTAQDIKGLLTVIADSQAGPTEVIGSRTQGYPDRVELESGKTVEGTLIGVELSELRVGDFSRDEDNMVVRKGATKPVKIRTADGKVHTYPASQIRTVAKEDLESLDASTFHKTVKLWLRQNRPFAMDHDRGPHVWNDCYDRADIEKTRTVPASVDPATLNGCEGPYGGGDLCFYTAKLMKGTNPEKSYKYWIEKKDGVDLNSGWLTGPGANLNPDFLWRPTKGKPSFTGENPRNPFVSPSLVKEVYERSL